MKKIAKSKLALNKVTVWSLDSKSLGGVAGGQPRNTENMSVCFIECCKSDYCGGSTGC
ncbi:MAG TPA: class I lanthipeptide [Kofleriaceae bacterium]|jgi:hypothetical protein|nr:class I lanthipeptide [Kofleriaceae bacterium]